uniref:Uncharacterized protein n=1 Tax=Glossina austeni TaxID=7395 RepID=A0A1A9V7L3_GLOAU
MFVFYFPANDVTHYVFGSMRHMDAFSFQSRNIGPTVEANLLMTIAINNSRYAKVHNIMSSTIARYRDMRGMNVAEGSINKAHNPMATNNNRIASDSERPLHSLSLSYSSTPLSDKEPVRPKRGAPLVPHSI